MLRTECADLIKAAGVLPRSPYKQAGYMRADRFPVTNENLQRAPGPYMRQSLANWPKDGNRRPGPGSGRACGSCHGRSVAESPTGRTLLVIIHRRLPLSPEEVTCLPAASSHGDSPGLTAMAAFFCEPEAPDHAARYTPAAAIEDIPTS